MTEILTESFCERCGTRYTFESSAPRPGRMRGIKVLGRGFKNFVMSDDASLDEALASARSDVEREATSLQLDAFHRTFKFCMSCRQYTCANCWNEADARCLSCAPLAVPEVLSRPEEIDPERLRRFTTPGSAIAAELHVHPEPVWPAEALVGTPFEAQAPDDALAAEAGAEAARATVIAEQEAQAAHVAAEQEAEAARVAAEETADAVRVAAELETAEAEAARVAAEETAEAVRVAAELETAEAEAALALEQEVASGPEPVAEIVPESQPETTGARIGGLEPGQSLDDAIAAYEAYEASMAPEAVAAAPEADAPIAATEAEAIIAASEASLPAVPEAEASPAGVAATASELPAPEARVDIVEQPAWPVGTEPPTTEALAPIPEVVAPAVPQPTGPQPPPQWPTGPRWPTAVRSHESLPPPAPSIDPLAAFIARSSTDAMWAASSRDVVEAPVASPTQTAGVHICSNCGISLSATARFCRRCGTAQG
jgi:hypothetical protein